MGKKQTVQQQERILALHPDRCMTVAEVMEGELGPGQRSRNWAAGPTYSEVWWREWEDELEQRANR